MALKLSVIPLVSAVIVAVPMLVAPWTMSTVESTPSPRASAPMPHIVQDLIPYPAKRKRQMAGYAWRHYHVNGYRLRSKNVKQIVLHFTTANDYASTHDFFVSNAKGGGNAGTTPEKPGNCSHFIVGKSGKIWQQAPLSIMCRATIGLNHRSVGIEFIEPTSAANILARPRQLAAGLALVRWLQAKFHVSTANVIGHAIANTSPYFVDYEGWFNDHQDWYGRHVRAFRRQL